MNQDLDFQFTIKPIPEGEAVTFQEVEERSLKELQEKDGKCVQSLINLAEVYSQTNRHDEAARCIERLIELSDDPEEHAEYCLALGCFMEQIRDYRGAVRFYRRALALEPCRSRQWYFINNNLGYSLNQLGDYDAAIPYFHRAIEIDPERPNAYKNLGLAFEAKGKIAEAAELFVTATQVNASDARSLAHLENLLSSHPELEVDVPNLRARLEACRQAVKVARARQPDLAAAWARDRKKQKRRT